MPRCAWRPEISSQSYVMISNVPPNHPLGVPSPYGLFQACEVHPVTLQWPVQGEAGTKCPAGTAITAASGSALQSLLSESRPRHSQPSMLTAVIDAFSRTITADRWQPALGGTALICVQDPSDPSRLRAWGLWERSRRP